MKGDGFQIPKITLDNVLGEGGLEEVFQEKLGDIVENIRDINTDPSKARELTIKLKLKSDKDRMQVFTSATISSKLTGIETTPRVTYITANTETGEATLGTINPLQIPLPFDTKKKEEQIS